MATNWAPEEVEAIVADYLDMLALELQGRPFNKTEHRRSLSRLLHGRSNGSIEWKHRNISAVLLEMGIPCIIGYLPSDHTQKSLLTEIVTQHVARSPELRALVERHVSQSAMLPVVANILAALTAPPEPELASAAHESASLDIYGSTPRIRQVNYLEMEARNASLGAAGEEFALLFERARLSGLGHERLAERIEWVSRDQGDGAGFDIRSFESDGRDKLIEVKTTAYGKETPFFVTTNELRTSQRRKDVFHLFRVFQFRTTPRLFTLAGSLDTTCALTPTQFSARVA